MKQVLVIRKDLGMRCGKMVSQGAHASQMARSDALVHSPESVLEWEENFGMAKITVRVESEAELLEIFYAALDAFLPASLIRDAGHTELTPGTATAVGIGPAPAESIDKITGRLKLL